MLLGQLSNSVIRGDHDNPTNQAALGECAQAVSREGLRQSSTRYAIQAVQPGFCAIQMLYGKNNGPGHGSKCCSQPRTGIRPKGEYMSNQQCGGAHRAIAAALRPGLSVVTRQSRKSSCGLPQTTGLRAGANHLSYDDPRALNRLFSESGPYRDVLAKQESSWSPGWSQLFRVARHVPRSRECSRAATAVGIAGQRGNQAASFLESKLTGDPRRWTRAARTGAARRSRLHRGVRILLLSPCCTKSRS